jgi:hypothetical protein
MSKSEFLYWGYGDLPGFYNPEASEAASLSQFAFWYFYVVVGAFLLFSPLTALLNIFAIIFLHWCGIEDLGYFLFARWIKLPPKYLATHPQIKILGFGIPETLPWLAKPRKIGPLIIPSIIGWLCGDQVPAKKFLALTISAILLIIIL